MNRPSDLSLVRARAKGLSETAVVWRHALPNALVPIVTVVGLQFGALLAGAIVTETIFSWPGLGRLTVSAISNRDYALVQGCLLSIGLTYVLVNFFTDVVYRWVNPRMRLAASGLFTRIRTVMGTCRSEMRIPRTEGAPGQPGTSRSRPRRAPEIGLPPECFQSA